MSTNDLPRMVVECRMPGVFKAISCNWLHHLIGSLGRGRVGQLHVDDQIAHVLRGDETFGGDAVTPNRDVDQPAINDEHQKTDAQHHADHARVQPGSPSEAGVEQAEEPTEQKIQQSACQPAGSGSQHHHRPRRQPRQQGCQMCRPIGRHALRAALQPITQPDGQKLPRRPTAAQRERQREAAARRRLCDPCRAVSSSRAVNAGLSVSELNAEMSVETAMVMANWRKKWPVMPLMKAHGTNTALSTRPTAMTGPDTCSIALIVASRGDRPCSM